MGPAEMPITPIPLLIVALAFVGATVALSISQALGLVERCNVYWDGCISVSAAARQDPAVHAFRATVVPHGTLLMLMWPLTVHWLRGLGAGTPAMRLAIALLGGISPPMLIYYVIGLGEEGAWIEGPRLIVIRIFFVMTLLAQVLTGVALHRHARAALAGHRPAVPQWLCVALLWVAIGMFGVALLSVPVGIALADPSVAHNLMQWYASSVYLAWFALLWLAWRCSGFTRLDWRPVSGR
ncbi:MAG: hypothetical protein ACNA7W_03695 [Pseudomonadales bacterium]